MLNMYCKLQMELNNVLLCCLPLPIAQSLPSDIGILVTNWSLAALITQATATASLGCRNASCGLRIVAEPLD